MVKRKYTKEEVNAAQVLLRKNSVRETARKMDIPKSVIGRWKKNPAQWSQKYQVTTEFEKHKAKLSKKEIRAFHKAKKEIIIEHPSPARESLIYTVDTDDMKGSWDYV